MFDKRTKGKMRDEQGFSLVELLAGVMIMAIVVTLGAVALRAYWLRQGLDRSSAEIATEMRGAQQRAMAESHPVVYGIRLQAGSRTWSIVQFDPRKSSNKCSEVERQDFATGVNPSAVSFTSGSEATTECRARFGSTSEFAFFFPRGTATPGTVTLRSPFSDYTRTVVVHGITGRAEEQVR